MFNAISLVGGQEVDFVPLTRDSFDRSAFERRRRLPWSDAAMYAINPADLVLSKLRWGAASESNRQLADVRAIMALGLFDETDAYFQRWLDRLGLRNALDASRTAGYDV